MSPIEVQRQADFHQGLERLIEWYLGAVRQLDRYPPTDLYQLLLCAREVGLNSPTIRSEVAKVAAIHDPPEQYRDHIVASVLRQVVLMRFDLALDDRLQFFDYWIGKNNVSGESVVSVAYIIGLAIEQLHLLPHEVCDRVRPWYLQNRGLTSDRLKAWAAKHLYTLGHESAARETADEVVSNRDSNGSWAGSHERTAAVLFALSHFPLVHHYDLRTSLNCLFRRLDRGLSGSTALEATTLKVAHVFGLLSPKLHSALIETATAAAVFVRHLPHESITRIHWGRDFVPAQSGHPTRRA